MSKVMLKLLVKSLTPKMLEIAERSYEEGFRDGQQGIDKKGVFLEESKANLKKAMKRLV